MPETILMLVPALLVLAASLVVTAPTLSAQEETRVEAIGEKDRVTLNLKNQDLGDVLEMFSTGEELK